MSKKIVEFDFNVNDKVITPFTDKAIIVMLGYESEDTKSYFVENNAQGIVNKWFRASDLKLAV